MDEICNAIYSHPEKLKLVYFVDLIQTLGAGVGVRVFYHNQDGEEFDIFSDNPGIKPENIENLVIVSIFTSIEDDNDSDEKIARVILHVAKKEEVQIIAINGATSVYHNTKKGD